MAADDLESRWQWRGRTHRRGWGSPLRRWRRWIGTGWGIRNQDEQLSWSNFAIQALGLGSRREGQPSRKEVNCVVLLSIYPCVVTFCPSVISSLLECWVAGLFVRGEKFTLRRRGWWLKSMLLQCSTWSRIYKTKLRWQPITIIKDQGSPGWY